MTGAAASFGPGAIAVTVAVAPGSGGVVEAVRIASTRPVGFSSALFVNRAADEVPNLVGRLHALCGLSHAAASAAAIAAARGEDGAGLAAGRFDGLLAERLGEHLRSTALGPHGGGAETPRDVLADLRAVLAATREIAAGVDAPLSAAARTAAVDRIRRGCDRLGLALDGHGRAWWPAGSWAEATSRRLGAGPTDRFLAVDPLGAADDAAVIAALAADPLGFSARPRLGTRRPETGPFARTVSRRGGGMLDARGRLEARLAEVARAARMLEAPAETRRREKRDFVHAGRIDERSGWAAVESPRGRLHHLVRLDASDRVAAYAIVAPTEWNFGPDGPFVATVRAERVTPDADGRARVERIAAAFDPCVGFDVTVEESAHA